MNTLCLIKNPGAKFSPAEIYLANRLRTLKSSYSSKSSFIKHLSIQVSGCSFTASEANRIWDVMHNMTFFDPKEDIHITAFDNNNKLCFPPEVYQNWINFFEDYAKQLLDENDIIQKRGPKPGTKPNKEEKTTSPTISELINQLLQFEEVDRVLILYKKHWIWKHF